MLNTMILLLGLICDVREVNSNFAVDHVDVIEINHRIIDGKVNLKQIIFYNWSNWKGKYVVVAWHVYKSSSQDPFKHQNGYLTIFYDTRDNVYRKVYAKSLTETWTDYDPIENIAQ